MRQQIGETKDKWVDQWQALGPLRFSAGILALGTLGFLAFSAAMVILSVFADVIPHVDAYLAGLGAREGSTFRRFFIDNMTGVCLVFVILYAGWRVVIRGLRLRPDPEETTE